MDKKANTVRRRLDRWRQTRKDESRKAVRQETLKEKEHIDAAVDATKGMVGDMNEDTHRDVIRVTARLLSSFEQSKDMDED